MPDQQWVFQRTLDKKVVEYRSKTTGQIIYHRLDRALAAGVRIVIHPESDVTPLLALSGVDQSPRTEFQHGTNMAKFPVRMNKGQKPIPYGRALDIDTLGALEAWVAEAVLS